MISFLVARNTFREATRDRMLLGVVVAGIVIFLVTQILNPLALGEGGRLTVDLGLSTISMLGMLIVLLIGTSLVAKEIDRRTIYNLLSRPISRHGYLLGKWCGLSASLWLVAASLGIALWGVLAFRGAGSQWPSLFEAVYLAALELTVVTSIAVLFSAISTPVLSALYTLGLYLVGQWTYDLRGLAERMPREAGGVIAVCANLAPNLPLFNMRTLAANAHTTSPAHLAIATLYALVYCGCVLGLATAAFETRDFK